MYVLKDHIAGGGLAYTHLILMLADAHARKVGVYQEHGQALITQGAVDGCDHAHKIRIACIGDKTFPAI